MSQKFSKLLKGCADAKLEEGVIKLEFAENADILNIIQLLCIEIFPKETLLPPKSISVFLREAGIKLMDAVKRGRVARTLLIPLSKTPTDCTHVSLFYCDRKRVVRCKTFAQ